MTVTYLRQNMVQEVIAEVFGVSQATVSRIICRLTPVLGDALAELIPTVAEATKGQVTLVDGTLMPCWSWRSRSELYSGKHHTTGHNVQVVADLEGNVLHISEPLPGNTHDIAALRTHNAPTAWMSHST